jgi:uncharacterized membrane protein HdeD (DUF308 family)
MWDLRLPAGWFFFGLGVVLCVYGLVVPCTAPLASEINVNLDSGIAMAVFGAVMLGLAFWRKA